MTFHKEFDWSKAVIRFDEIDLLEFMMELDISIIWSRKICYLH